MIAHAKPMTLRGGEVIAVHPRTGEPGRWPVDGAPVQYRDVAEIPTGRTWLAASIHEELTLITSTRDDVIAGLRELADWLEAHPDVPISAEQIVSYWPSHGGPLERRAEVDRVAKILGVPAGPRTAWKSSAHAARRRFAGVTFEAAAYGVHPGRVP